MGKITRREEIDRISSEPDKVGSLRGSEGFRWRFGFFSIWDYGRTEKRYRLKIFISSKAEYRKLGDALKPSGIPIGQILLMSMNLYGAEDTGNDGDNSDEPDKADRPKKIPKETRHLAAKAKNYVLDKLPAKKRDSSQIKVRTGDYSLLHRP